MEERLSCSESKMDEQFIDEFDPLFDYSRLQPADLVYLNEDSSDSSPSPEVKKRKGYTVTEGNEGKSCNIVNLESQKEFEEDWLPSPPKRTSKLEVLTNDSMVQELRLKKQELLAFARAAEDALREVEGTSKHDAAKDAPSSEQGKLLKQDDTRKRVVISIQGKDGLKQYRMFVDDKFEGIFKIYAQRMSCVLEKLVFTFDGDRVDFAATPEVLGMEDDDIIEVHQKY